MQFSLASSMRYLISNREVQFIIAAGKQLLDCTVLFQITTWHQHVELLWLLLDAELSSPPVIATIIVH